MAELRPIRAAAYALTTADNGGFAVKAEIRSPAGNISAIASITKALS